MAINKHPGTPNRVIIPVAGAFNARQHIPGINLSTAAIHFSRLRHHMEGEHWTVEEPVVPDWLGLRDIDHTYASSRIVIEHKMDKYPGARVVLLTHSLGGMVGARFATEHADDPRFAGTETLDTPHRPNFSGPLGILATSTMSGLIRHGQDFTDETAARAETASRQGQPARIKMIGTTASGLVSPRGSLPDLAGSERFLFANENDIAAQALQNEGVTIVHETGINHMTILTDSRSIRFISQVAGNLVPAEIGASNPVPGYVAA